MTYNISLGIARHICALRQNVTLNFLLGFLVVSNGSLSNLYRIRHKIVYVYALGMLYAKNICIIFESMRDLDDRKLNDIQNMGLFRNPKRRAQKILIH